MKGLSIPLLFILAASTVALAVPAAAQQTNGGDGAGAADVGHAGDPAGEFVVRPGDMLRIRVWPDSSLSGLFPVEESGYTYLPVLGAVKAGGVALPELRASLRRAYGEALKAPAVEVTPLFKVSVLGGVVRPGLYQVDPTQTLFDAISLAGGFAPGAKQKQVELIRNDRVIKVNAKQAMKVGGAPLALALQSGDRIVVPQGQVWRPLDIFYAVQSLALVITLITKVH